MHLSESARVVFDVLAGAGTATRPQLAAGAGLSKPTVSTAVAELEAVELAAHSGRASGGTGRSAAVYRLGPAAGAVLAVDLGPATTRVRSCALDGTLLAEGTGTRAEAAGTVRKVLDGLPAGAPLRAVVVAVGDVTTRDGEGAGERPATAKAGPVFDAMAVALPEGVPVHLENNVNCAALAELHEGAAVGRETFGYLRIGVGIGLAVVIGGRVLRGANGAAGEVARLPYPWDESRAPHHEGLEQRMGSRTLLRRAAEAWQQADGPRPPTAERLLALAGQGHATARSVIDAHAADVGRLAAAVAAVLDLVVAGAAAPAHAAYDPANVTPTSLNGAVNAL
ncbi:ROK family protein, partial [Streptomyces massasporeus]|uniref:ROK family protein n=1 Tax=Streptomyces massasporeus TaxID=67324 RepID=UPI0033CB09B9